MMLFSSAALCLALWIPDALSERLEAYRAAEGDEARVAALVDLAALSGAPAEQAPEPEALCLALAEGLQDDSPLVRSKAVPLVAGAGAPRIAAERLLAATVVQVELEREIDERVRGYVTSGSGLGDMFSESKREREKARKALARLNEEAEAMSAYLEGLKDVPTLRVELTKAWSQLPDARAVDGLALLFEDAGFSEKADPIVDGLFGIGTAPALAALVQHVDRYQGVRKERDRRARELKRAKPRKKPSDLWSDEVWRKNETERMAKQMETFEAGAAAQDAWLEAYLERLRAFGEANDLGKPPRAWKPARAWKSWSAKSADQLPPSPESKSG